MNWLKYNINQNTYHPLTVNDVITNKFDKTHKELYDNALEIALKNEALSKDSILTYTYSDVLPENSLILSYKNNKYCYVDLSDYKIIEINNEITDNYITAPKVLISTRKIFDNGKFIFRQKTIDLAEYWNNKYEKTFTSKFENARTENIDEEYPFNDIVYYDYVNGKATLENRVEYSTNKIDFSKISENDNLKIEEY